MKPINIILEENEKILWQSKIAEKGLNRNIFYISLCLTFLVLQVIAPIILISEKNLITLINNLSLFSISFYIFLVYIASIGVVAILIIIYLIHYLELKNLEYYITNIKEFDIKIGLFKDLEVQTLNLKDITKIKIHHLRTSHKLGHVDFYSKKINENPEETYFKFRNIITKGTLAFKKLPLQLRNTQDIKKHRFYYVEDLEKIKEVLSKIISEKAIEIS